MDIVELDPSGFPRLLHAMLRANDSPEEVARAKAVLQWIAEHLPTVREVLESLQSRLFAIIWQHYCDHDIPVDRTHVEQMIHTHDKPDGLLSLLEDYDRMKPHLPVTSVLAMPQLLAERVADWEKVRLLLELHTAKMIAMGMQERKSDKEPLLRGARDAVASLFDALHSGIIVDQNPTIGGDAKRDMITILTTHDRNKADREGGKLQMQTGLACLDNVLRGLRKREFVGVLGYAGSFKSTLCRTILYNAATQGFNCIHVPLESSYDEELMLYGIMHAHTKTFVNMLPSRDNITPKSFEDGLLTDTEKDFLRSMVIPHFKNSLKGNVVIRQPADSTWPEVRQLIEMDDRKRKLHLALVDYWALMGTGDSRNPVATINETFRLGKKFCLNFRNGEGLALMTPLQGNREGYDDAAANGGMWTQDKVYMYSEAEKSVDKMIYVFTDDGLKSSDTLKVGVCKSRRTVDVGATLVKRHPASGLVMDADGGDTPVQTDQAKAAGSTKDILW